MKSKLNILSKICIPEYLFPGYFWSFIFLHPIVSMYDSLSTVILSISMVFFMTLFIVGYLYKLFKINFKVLYYIFILTAVFSLNLILITNSELLKIIYEFIYMVLVPMLFYSGIKNYKKTLYVFSVLSAIAVLIFALSPIYSSPHFQIGYMEYGYNFGLPAAIGCYIGYRFYKKKYFLLLFVLQLICVFIFANRGALLGVLLAVLLFKLFYIDNIKKTILFFTCAFISVIILKFYIVDILELVISISEYFDIDSYSLHKYMNYLNSSSDSMLSDDSFLSGRDRIWTIAKSYIVESPIYGYGFGFLRSKYSFYSHNILLNILLDGGFLLLGVHVILFLTTSYKFIFYNYDYYLRALLILFISLAFPRLLMSSQYLLDVGYACFISSLPLLSRFTRKKNDYPY